MRFQCIFIILVDLLYIFFNCSPAVKFSGYSIPHPLENKIHLKIENNSNCNFLSHYSDLFTSWRYCLFC